MALVVLQNARSSPVSSLETPGEAGARNAEPVLRIQLWPWCPGLLSPQPVLVGGTDAGQKSGQKLSKGREDRCICLQRPHFLNRRKNTSCSEETDLHRHIRDLSDRSFTRRHT